MYHELCCFFSEGTPSEGRTYQSIYPSLRELEQELLPMNVYVPHQHAATPKKKGPATPKSRKNKKQKRTERNRIEK